MLKIKIHFENSSKSCYYQGNLYRDKFLFIITNYANKLSANCVHM